MASETEHWGQKQMRWAEDFWRGRTPTVCAKRKTATDFCPASSSRLQRRQYKWSKPVSALARPQPLGGDHLLLSPRRCCGRKYVEGFLASAVEPSFALGKGESIAHSKAMGVDRTVKRAAVKLARRQQVAAVCYRIRKRGVELLLVQTRGGRWIFPKGGLEPGLTPAQSAALEAFEEAGVHGRMEETPFARYFRVQPEGVLTRKSERRAEPCEMAALPVVAYLCEVSYLEPPQESDRNPTWFSAEGAKRRLREGRALEFGSELSRIVDRAAARVRRLQGNMGLHSAHGAMTHGRMVPSKRDPLHEVRFEASELSSMGGMERTNVYARYIRREHPERGTRSATSLGSARPLLRLGSGSASSPEASNAVRYIDESGLGGRGKATLGSARNRRA